MNGIVGVASGPLTFLGEYMEKNLIKARHEKLDKKFFEAMIDESQDLAGLKYSTTFKVKGVKDKKGWYTKFVLIAKGDQWTERLRNKPIVSFENFDGGCVIKFFDEKKKIELPLCTIADLNTLLWAVSKFDDIGLFSKKKMYTRKPLKKKSKK
jgi:hypothetical protein